MSFGTIFSDVILGWYYNIFGWKLSKQTSYWSKTGFFFSVKNHNNFSSQNIVISSQNNVPKFRIKGHEQVFNISLFIFSSMEKIYSNWLTILDETNLSTPNMLVMRSRISWYRLPWISKTRQFCLCVDFPTDHLMLQARSFLSKLENYQKN